MPRAYDGIPVVDIEGGFTRCGEVRMGTEPWRDLNTWAIEHGLDPHKIVARTGITRDADACCIRFTTFVLDDAGEKVVAPARLGEDLRFELKDAVEQGETPPLPFPASIEFRPAVR